MQLVLKVVVVARIPLVREGLRALLINDPEIQVRAFSEFDPDLMLEGESVSIPDVLLLDVEVLEQEGWRLLNEIKHTLPGLATLIVGDATSDPRSKQAIELGAVGYLTRDSSADQMIAAVRAAQKGLVVFDSSNARILLQAGERGSAWGDANETIPSDGNSAQTADLIEPLSQREREVLRLLARGLANKQIAGELMISEHTVKFHIRSILGKLGASNRTEAVTLGLQKGLVSL